MLQISTSLMQNKTKNETKKLNPFGSFYATLQYFSLCLSVKKIVRKSSKNFHLIYKTLIAKSFCLNNHKFRFINLRKHKTYK